jgi:hypothetical protein
MQMVSVRGSGVGSEVSVGKIGVAVLVAGGNSVVGGEGESGVETTGVSTGPQEARRNASKATIPMGRR